jgi:phage-related protein
LTNYASFGIVILDDESRMKQLIFVSDSHRALVEFPAAVQRHVGFALYQAQLGNRHVDARPLKNSAGGVLEVVSDHRGDTFRTVYTVKTRAGCLCATRVSEKVQARNRDTAGRP